MSRATMGQAISSMFGMFTGVMVLGEQAVTTSSKSLVIVDNLLETGVHKSENFRKRAALADDAEYLLDIVSLIESNPEVGEIYLNDPDLLPEGINLDVLMSMVNKTSKPSVVVSKPKQQVRIKSKGKARSRVSDKSTEEVYF